MDNIDDTNTHYMWVATATYTLRVYICRNDRSMYKIHRFSNYEVPIRCGISFALTANALEAREVCTEGGGGCAEGGGGCAEGAWRL